MDLTPAQAGLVGYMTRNPFHMPGTPPEKRTGASERQRQRARSRALEALADLLVQSRAGRGRKPGVSYPALTARQLADRQRRERPLTARLATHPTSSGVLRAS